MTKTLGNPFFAIPILTALAEEAAGLRCARRRLDLGLAAHTAPRATRQRVISWSEA